MVVQNEKNYLVKTLNLAKNLINNNVSKLVTDLVPEIWVSGFGNAVEI
jgi:hypothetical protein